MKFCPNCGKPVKEGSSFCGSCGAKLAAFVVPETPAPAAPVETPAPAEVPAAPQAPVEQPAPAPAAPVETPRETPAVTEPMTSPASEVPPPPVPPAAPTAGPGSTEPLTPPAPAAPSAPSGGGVAAPPSGGTAFCPHCGERIPRGLEQCPNCGAVLKQPVEPGRGVPEEAPKKKSKAPLFISLAAAAAVVVAAVVLLLPKLGLNFGGGAAGSSAPGAASSEPAPVPSVEFVALQESMVASRTAGLATLLNQAGGATQFTWPEFKLSTDAVVTMSGSGEDYTEDVNQALANSSVTLRIDADAKKGVVNAIVNLMGTDVLSGAATYDLDAGKVGFYLPQASNSYYTASIDELFSTLTGMDWNAQMEALMAQIESATNVPELPTYEELTALAESYLDILNIAVTEENVTMEEDLVELNGLDQDFDGVIYTYTPGAEELEEMFLALADKLEEDQDLRDLLSPYTDALVSLEPETGMDMDPDSLLKQAAEELRDSAADAAAAIEESGFTWKLGVVDGEVRLIRLKTDYATIAYETVGSAEEGWTDLFYVRDDDEEIVRLLSEYAVEDSGVTWDIEMEVEGNKSGISFSNIKTGNSTDIVATLTENDVTEMQLTCLYTEEGGKYEGSLALTIPNGSSGMTLTFEADTGSRSGLGIPYGSYSFQVSSSRGLSSFTLDVGAGDSGGNKYDLEVAAGGETVALHLTTTGASTANWPSVAETDISNYTYEELETLMDTLGQDLSTSIISILVGTAANE